MDASCRIEVKALPNAPRDAVAGWSDGVLRVRVRAPALEGRANEALCRFLAESLGLPRGRVTLVQGAKARRKLVQVEGLDLAGVRSRLGAL